MGDTERGAPSMLGQAPRARRRARAQKRRRRAVGAIALAAVAVALAVALAGGRASRARAPLPRSSAHPQQAGGGQAGASAAGGRAGVRTAAGRSGESSEIRRLIALGRPIYCAAHRGNEVALTFDDGPGPYTRLVLAKLRKHRVKATFFVVGRNIDLVRGPDGGSIVRQERAAGMVGDHTFTHPLLTSLTRAGAEREIVGTQSALARASGAAVFLFRPPYGAHNATVDAIARSHGLLEILWSVDSADSLGANYAQIERTVIGGLHPGAIILMHENHGQTVRALINIFAALKRKHLRAVSVAQLLTDDAPSPAQVRAAGGSCGLSAHASLSGA